MTSPRITPGSPTLPRPASPGTSGAAPQAPASGPHRRLPSAELPSPDRRSTATSSAPRTANPALLGIGGPQAAAASATAGASADKQATVARLDSLCASIADRTALSTTGYQIAMRRLNNRDQPDGRSQMTLARAEQYTAAAKHKFPTETLKGLAELQQGINSDGKGGLVSPIEMTPEQLGPALRACRQQGFANCDMQALEVGIHLKHELGISNFKIYSNDALSHNYAVIDPCDKFPKGAAVDPWTGQGVQEMGIMTKLKLKHNDANCKVNDNMMAFIDQHGADYVHPS